MYNIDQDFLYFLSLISNPNIHFTYKDSVKFHDLFNQLVHFIELNGFKENE